MGTALAVECRCANINEMQGADAEGYVAEHLQGDPERPGEAFVCPDTGKEWRYDESDPEQPRLVGRPR